MTYIKVRILLTVFAKGQRVVDESYNYLSLRSTCPIFVYQLPNSHLDQNLLYKKMDVLTKIRRVVFLDELGTGRVDQTLLLYSVKMKNMIFTYAVWSSNFLLNTMVFCSVRLHLSMEEELRSPRPMFLRS